MTTLTKTTYYTRKIFKLSLIFLLAFFILKNVFGVIRKYWLAHHPPPPPPPTVSFGKLPKIQFPQNTQLPELTFRLETIQGNLPNLPTIGKVYFMPKNQPNLLALDRAAQMAKKMGFQEQPEPITKTVYRWKNGQLPATTLEIDINSLNFHLRYDYENDSELLISKYLPTNEQSTQEIKNFLTVNGLLAPDLAEGTAEFEYLKFGSPKLLSAMSLSDSDFVRVNLFRADLDGLKILPPNPKKSLISFLFSGSRVSGKRIVEINYTYYPIERDIFATYPLKPTLEAWNELQAGKGYIANLGQNEDGKIIIRRVYLAFYDSETPQHYLQPIYVFEGDKNFWGYVSAVDPKWTE